MHLLDLSATDSNAVRLLDTAKKRPTDLYMTLSHSWGGAQIAQLRRHNSDAFARSIPLGALPKTSREISTTFLSTSPAENRLPFSCRARSTSARGTVLSSLGRSIRGEPFAAARRIPWYFPSTKSGSRGNIYSRGPSGSDQPGMGTEGIRPLQIESLLHLRFDPGIGYNITIV
jgi:hypothetical protein